MGTNFEYSFVVTKKIKKSFRKNIFLEETEKDKLVSSKNGNLHFNGKTFTSTTLVFRHFYAQFLDLRFKQKSL